MLDKNQNLMLVELNAVPDHLRIGRYNLSDNVKKHFKGHTWMKQYVKNLLLDMISIVKKDGRKPKHLSLVGSKI